MKTYIEIEIDYIVEFYGDTQTPIYKDRLSTRTIDGAEILDYEGEPTGTFEQVIEEYCPWDELMDSGVEVERIDRDALQVEQDALAAKARRETSLNSIIHTVNGKTVQVRPKDLPNFNLAISMNQETRWILADNTVAVLTVEELQECMSSGILQGKQIWEDFFDA